MKDNFFVINVFFLHIRTQKLNLAWGWKKKNFLSVCAVFRLDYSNYLEFYLFPPFEGDWVCCNRCLRREKFPYLTINRHFNKFTRSFWSIWD
jgi:hypothetical protein